MLDFQNFRPVMLFSHFPNSKRLRVSKRGLEYLSLNSNVTIKKFNIIETNRFLYKCKSNIIKNI